MISFLRDNAAFLSVGIILTFASSFGQTYFISTFAGGIQDGFSLGHGQWGGLYAAATTASAVCMAWAGTLTDHFRVRALAPLALVGLATAAMAMSVAQSWWMLAVVVFALRFFGQGMLSHIAMVAMARWYVARRGKALAISGLGYSAGEAFLPMTVVALMGGFDWRNLWVVAAVVCVALVPVLRVLLRLERTPQSAAARDEAAGMYGRHWSRRDALANPVFWLLVPVIAGPGAFLTALFFQQVHLTQVKGWNHAELVAIFPVYTFVALGAMILAGWALDKWGAVRLAPLCQTPMVAGFLVLWASVTPLGAMVAFVLIGLSFGVYATLFAAFWAEVYGTRHLGAIKSLVAAVMVLGSAMGPGISGFAIDRGMNFVDQTPFIATYFVAATVLILIATARARAALSGAA